MGGTAQPEAITARTPEGEGTRTRVVSPAGPRARPAGGLRLSGWSRRQAARTLRRQAARVFNRWRQAAKCESDLSPQEGERSTGHERHHEAEEPGHHEGDAGRRRKEEEGAGRRDGREVQETGPWGAAPNPGASDSESGPRAGTVAG